MKKLLAATILVLLSLSSYAELTSPALTVYLQYGETSNHLMHSTITPAGKKGVIDYIYNKDGNKHLRDITEQARAISKDPGIKQITQRLEDLGAKYVRFILTIKDQYRYRSNKKDLVEFYHFETFFKSTNDQCTKQAIAASKTDYVHTSYPDDVEKLMLKSIMTALETLEECLDGAKEKEAMIQGATEDFSFNEIDMEEPLV